MCSLVFYCTTAAIVSKHRIFPVGAVGSSSRCFGIRTSGTEGPSKRLSKEILVGRIEPGARLAQVVVKMKDEVGAMADVNSIIASQKVDVRQSLTYSLPHEQLAVYNAFVSLNDSKVSLNRLVERLEESAFVIEVQAFEGREGAVVDVISFPVNWQGRRVVILAQHAIARMFEGIFSLFGSGGLVVLYEQGMDYGRDLAEHFIRVLGKDFLVRNPDYLLNVLAATGWGIPELSGSNSDFPDMGVKLSSCLECDGRSSNQTVCSFVRGFLAGVFGTIASRTVHCEESRCIAKGDPACQFELHSSRSTSAH
jgi:predicted hydrocarbon binding protein